MEMPLRDGTERRAVGDGGGGDMGRGEEKHVRK